MIKNKRIAFIWVLPIFIALTSCNEEYDKPNILFLVIEDTSPYLLPAYGNDIIKTPNLDFLVTTGVVFDNAFANAPHCSPARSTLISGTLATAYGNDIQREGHFQPENYFLPKFKMSHWRALKVRKLMARGHTTGHEL